MQKPIRAGLAEGKTMKIFTPGGEVWGLLVAALMLGSCAVNLPVSEPVAVELPIWGRIDCQRGANNPAIQTEFEAAKALCRSRGDSAETTAGAAGSSACMTGQGYILRTPNEHAAGCEAILSSKKRG